MAKRGPKPTPTAILKLHGSRQVEQREAEPSPEISVPPAPAWLSKVGRKEWDRITAELAKQNLLTHWDQSTLALYCESFAEYLAARKIVEKEGLVAVTDKGNAYQHPAVGVMHEAWRQVVKAAALFGLSPADRASLGIVGAKKAPSQVMSRSRAG